MNERVNFKRTVWEITDRVCVHGIGFHRYCATCDQPHVPIRKRLKRWVSQILGEEAA